MSKNQIGENSAGWKGRRVLSACMVCQKEFQTTRAEVDRGNGKYCSFKCSTIARDKREEVKCAQCGVLFKVKRYRIESKKDIFCSTKCKSQSQIKNRTAEEIAMRKLNNRIASVMNQSLKGNKNGSRWESLVSYTAVDLKAHLEDLFQEGMSWGNMGKWHIDHIKPRCLFNFTKPSEPGFRECWDLSNLQPLWAVDNLKKGSKYINKKQAISC